MAKRFAVIGMGKFGMHLVAELTRKGAEVLALDNNLEHLEDVKDVVSHVVELDSTDTKALKSQRLDEFDAVIVAFGEDFEVALLTIAALQQLEINRIIARATTPTHEKILQHLGIKEVILPVVEAADRLANSLMFEGVLDTFDVSTDYTIVELPAPDTFIDRSLTELSLQENYGLMLVTIKRNVRTAGLFGPKTTETIIGIPSPATMIERGDILIVFGTKKGIQKFTQDQLPGS